MPISVILILLAVAIYGFLHSLLASRKVKDALRQRLGAGADRWYRLAYVAFVTLTLFPVAGLVGLLPDRHLYAIPFPWLLLTSALQIVSIACLVWGVLQTDVWSFVGIRQLLQESPAKPGDQPPPRLVTTGLYHYVRHPLYSAGLLFLWLTPLMTWNLLALNLGLTLYILVGIVFEERKLVLEFGEPYRQYRRRTPALIPGLPGSRK